MIIIATGVATKTIATGALVAHSLIRLTCSLQFLFSIIRSSPGLWTKLEEQLMNYAWMTCTEVQNQKKKKSVLIISLRDIYQRQPKQSILCWSSTHTTFKQQRNLKIMMHYHTKLMAAKTYMFSSSEDTEQAIIAELNPNST